VQTENLAFVTTLSVPYFKKTQEGDIVTGE
jgi:hypothetical protein